MHCRLAEDQALERRGTEQSTQAHVPATACPDCVASLPCWGRMRVLEQLAHKMRCRGVIQQRLRRYSRSALALVPAAGVRYSHAGRLHSRVPSGSGSCVRRSTLQPPTAPQGCAHCAPASIWSRRHECFTACSLTRPSQASTPPPRFQVRLRVTPAIM